MLQENDIAHCQYVIGFNTERLMLRVVAVIGFVAITLLQWLLTACLPVWMVVVLQVLAALAVAAYYQALRHATPNGGNAQHHRISVPVLLVVLLILLYDLAGAWQLAVYKSGVFNRPFFIAWLLGAAGGPVLYFSFRYGRCTYLLQQHYKHYVKLYLTIYHDNDLPIVLDNLSFVNTVNGNTARLNIQQQQFAYTGPQEMQALDLQGRQQIERHELYSQTVYIPLHANKFYLSWYSPVESRYYCDEFVFRFERFTLEEDKPAGASVGRHARRLPGIDLYVQSGGRVNLYSRGTMIFFYYEVAQVAATQEQLHRYTSQLRQQLLPGKPDADFTALIAEINSSQRLQLKQTIQQKMFLWRITLTGLGSISHAVKIKDVNYNSFNRSVEALATPVKWYLPACLQLYKRIDEDHYFYLNILLDYTALYTAVEQLTRGDASLPVHIAMDNINRTEKTMACSIQAAGASVVFNGWLLMERS